MPLLNKKQFVRIKPPANIKDDDKVFFCEATSEVFTEYDLFWERLVLLNSLVWTCELTGKPNLTFQEAIDSENKAKKSVANVSAALKIPILYISTLTKRKKIADMNEDVFNFLRDRYFVEEEVEAIIQKHWYDCKVTKVVMPTQQEIEDYQREMADSDSEEDLPKPMNGTVDDDDIMIIHDDNKTRVSESEKSNKSPVKIPSEEMDDHPPFASVKYEVKEIEPWDYKQCQKHVVKWNQIRRSKSALTREKCKLFLKQCVTLSPLGFWTIKESLLKKYDISSLPFTEVFVGKPPKFEHSIAKAPIILPNKASEKKKNRINETKEEKVSKKKEKKEPKQKRSIENVEGNMANIKKKLKPNTALQEIKLVPPKSKEDLKAEKEKQREESKLLLEVQRLEKKKNRDASKEEVRLMSLAMSIWNEPVEDLILDDHKELPEPTSIHCRIPSEYFGDFLMVLQFVNVFSESLEIGDVYHNGITFDMLEHAFIEKEVAGIYNDIMQLLIGAIFTLQQEEAEEILEGNSKCNETINVESHLESKTHKAAASLANEASTWILQNLGVSLQKAPLDALTLTELIRVHLLASGATTVSNAYWRMLNRGGYQSTDDPGFQFKIDEPEILKKLSTETIFDLTLGEKVKLFNTLISQIITYASVRDSIDENIEKLKELRNEMRQFRFAESRKEKEEVLIKKQKEKEERLKKIEKLKASLQKGLENKAQGEGDGLKLADDTGDKEKSDVTAKDVSEIVDIDVNDNEECEEDLREKEEAKREKKQADFQKRINSFLAKLSTVGQKVCELPLGEDRCHRRYWLYSSLPALVVEDFPQNVGPCVQYEPITSKSPEDSLEFRRKIHIHALKNIEEMQKLKVDKSTSDKENEAKIPSNLMDPPAINGDLHTSPSIDRKLKEESDEDFIYSILPVLAPDVVENGDSHSKQLRLCSSDPDTCPIHSCNNRPRWMFFSNVEQFQRLLESLNRRGVREESLLKNLLERREEVENCIKECPTYKLNSEEQPQIQPVERKSLRGNQILGSPSANLNFSSDTPVSTIFELTLRDMILEFEDKICLGFLGSLKVAVRDEWRLAIENGTSLTPQEHQVDIGGKNRINEFKVQLGIEKKEEPIKMEETSEKHSIFNELRMAIISLGKAMEHKYLKEPLGESDKVLKLRLKAENRLRNMYRKDAHDSSSDDDEEGDRKKANVSDHRLRTPLERWEKSLSVSTSYSQLFLHLAVLDSSVTWARSVLKAACSKCRKKSDPENMLLCDECNRGYHMYCLVPKLKTIPSGDWFCEICKPKEKAKSPKKKRKIYKDISDDEIEKDLDEQEAEEIEEENQEFCSACEMDGELILCDTCPKSFHLDCADLRKVPRGQWSCPLCKEEEEKSSSRRRGVKRPLEEVDFHREEIEQILADISELGEYDHFKKSPNRAENPDYYSKIKKPMDFKTIRNRFNRGRYTLDTEFAADVLLIFQNCQQYFKESSAEYKASVKVSKLFIKKSEEYNLNCGQLKKKRRK